MKKNQANILLEKHLRELGLYFTSEYRFAHPKRAWRFDYVVGRMGLMLPEDRAKVIAIEIEGGIWMNGRHSRGKGYQADLDKYNAAAMMGYRVLRFSTEDVLRGRAKAFLAEHLGGKSCPT